MDYIDDTQSRTDQQSSTETEDDDEDESAVIGCESSVLSTKVKVTKLKLEQVLYNSGGCLLS